MIPCIIQCQMTGVSVNMPYLYIFQEFTLTDDTVLEEHYEDPRLTQMSLLGDGGNTTLFDNKLSFLLQ